MLTGPAEVVEPFAAQHGERVRGGRLHRGHRDGRAPRHGGAHQEGLVDRGRRAAGQGRARRTRSSRRAAPVPCMAAATLVMGRIKGVQRPAIATVLPTAGPPCVLLDVGANADCKPENLLQFAADGRGIRDGRARRDRTAGRAAQHRRGADARARCSRRTRTRLMSDHVPHFIGNVEGRDVLAGVSDVIVTDGFTGNVALKLLEGTSKILLGQVKDAITSTPFNTAASAVLKPALNRLRSRLDPDTYGGAPLLGVDGVCIIGHGSSKAAAIASAISVAAQAGRGGLTGADRHRGRGQLDRPVLLLARHGSCTLPRRKAETFGSGFAQHGHVDTRDARLHMTRHACHHRDRVVPAREHADQRRPRADGRHLRRVDRVAHRHPGARIVAEAHHAPPTWLSGPASARWRAPV